MLGATLWIAYGILIAAKPVIAANLLVFGAGGLDARTQEEAP